MNKPIFPGAFLFNLKATHGFPLEMALDMVINDEGLAVSWVDFIEEARLNDWSDAQTYKTISYALSEAGVPGNIREQIESRAQKYITEGFK